MKNHRVILYLTLCWAALTVATVAQSQSINCDFEVKKRDREWLPNTLTISRDGGLSTYQVEFQQANEWGFGPVSLDVEQYSESRKRWNWKLKEIPGAEGRFAQFAGGQLLSLDYSLTWINGNKAQLIARDARRVTPFKMVRAKGICR